MTDIEIILSGVTIVAGGISGGVYAFMRWGMSDYKHDIDEKLKEIRNDGIPRCGVMDNRVSHLENDRVETKELLKSINETVTEIRVRLGEPDKQH